MGIMTINDLLTASKGDINRAIEEVYILQDLSEWIMNLNKVGSEIVVPTSIRYGKGATPGIYPSTACKQGTCMLRMYYDCTGEMEAHRTIDLVDQSRFDIGHLFHEYIQTHLEHMYGEQFEKEAKIRDKELHLRGRADGIFTFSIVRFILELKSIKEGGSYGMEKVHSKPLKEHMRQTQIYMAARNIPFALIVYWCKNTSEFKEHVVVFDQNEWENILGPIQKVVDAAFLGSTEWVSDEGYPVPAAPGGNCRFCDYSYTCPARRKKDESRHIQKSKTTTRRSRRNW